MTTYKELLQQREALEQRIHEFRQREVLAAVEQARATVAEFSLTADDIFGSKRASLAGSKAVAKYRDPVSGATWTGRGKPPRWIAAQERERFLIS